MKDEDDIYAVKAAREQVPEGGATSGGDALHERLDSKVQTPEQSAPTGTVESGVDPVKARLEEKAQTGVPHREASTEAWVEDLADKKELSEGVRGYDRVIGNLRAEADRKAPETDEQRAARERREKSRKLVSGITDGLTALSNLYFTTQDAPSMYDHEKQSQGKATLASIEKARAERKENEAAYNNLMVQLGNAETARARTLREMQADQERRKIARQKAAQEADKYNWEKYLRPYKEAKQRYETDKAGYDAETARYKAEYAPRQQEAELETKHTRSAANRASAAKSHSASVYGVFDGKEYYNQRDYDKAVRSAALAYNERLRAKGKEEYKVPVEWEEETAYGKKIHNYGSAQVAGLLEPLLEQERKEEKRNVSGGRKKSPTSGSSAKKSPTGGSSAKKSPTGGSSGKKSPTGG